MQLRLLADKLSPLDLIAMVEENTDLLPATADGDALEERLANRLLDLDLPQRAAQVLERLMRAAPGGNGRARFGTSLASLQLREGDPAAALATLNNSLGGELTAALLETRALLSAAAHGRRGETQAALAVLAPLGTAPADEARASILEQVQDWAGAEQALNAYVAKVIPSSGDLDDTNRRLLLRLATAAARAGDDPALAALRSREEGRIGGGPLADMFRLLTADPVRDATDLPRAKRETGWARSLPVGLNALQPVSAAR